MEPPSGVQRINMRPGIYCNILIVGDKHSTTMKTCVLNNGNWGGGGGVGSANISNWKPIISPNVPPTDKRLVWTLRIHYITIFVTYLFRFGTQKVRVKITVYNAEDYIVLENLVILHPPPLLIVIRDDLLLILFAESGMTKYSLTPSPPQPWKYIPLLYFC